MYFCIENTKGLKYILVLKEKKLKLAFNFKKYLLTILFSLSTMKYILAKCCFQFGEKVEECVNFPLTTTLISGEL